MSGPFWAHLWYFLELLYSFSQCIALYLIEFVLIFTFTFNILTPEWVYPEMYTYLHIIIVTPVCSGICSVGTLLRHLHVSCRTRFRTIFLWVLSYRVSRLTARIHVSYNIFPTKHLHDPPVSCNLYIHPLNNIMISW